MKLLSPVRRSLAVITAVAALCALPATAHATHTVDHQLPAFGIGHIKVEWLASDLNGLADFGLMQSSAIGMYRTRFRQDMVLANGSYSNWGQLDGVVREASRKGVAIAPILMNMPGEDYTPPLTKSARNRFGDFAAAAVRRYGPAGTFWSGCGCPKLPIRAWEVWNEPNITPFWDAPDPVAYAYLLRDTRAKIRKADPRARIVFGGLAHPTTPTATKQDPGAFLQRVIATVGSNQFDAVAVHAYQRDAADALAKLTATIQALKTYGGVEGAGPRHQVWVNEYGRYIVPDDPATENDELAVSEQRQLEWITAMTDTLLSHRADWNVAHLSAYMMRDNYAPTAAWHRYGLRRTNADDSDGGPRPAWDAYSRRAATGGVVDLPKLR